MQTLINVKKADYYGFTTSFGVGLAAHDGELLHYPTICRTYNDDKIWQIKTGEVNKFLGETYKAVLCIKPSQREGFSENLAKVNELFSKYSIAPCVWEETQEENLIVVDCDPIWFSEIWKSSLLTNYLKTCYNEDSYKKLRDANEHLLLSLVTRDNDEALYDSTGSNHGSSGFVSLLYGNNLKNKHIIANYIKEHPDVKIIK